jgi:hypothetical protein
LWSVNVFLEVAVCDNMENSDIAKILDEILHRLVRIEDAIRNNSMRSIVQNRQESIDYHRITYNRQLGYSDNTILPINPDAEDEID